MIQKEMMVYAKRYGLYRVLSWITVLQVVNLLTNIGIVWVISSLLSSMLLGQPVTVTGSAAGFAILVLLIKWFCHYWGTKLTHYTSHELKSKLRNALLQKLLSLTPLQISKLEISKISQLSVEGIENIDVYYSRYLPQLFYSLIAPMILFTALAAIHWKIALFLIISMILIPVSIVGAVKLGKRVFHSYWNKYLNVGKTFVEGVQGLHVLKMYGGDHAYQEKMHKEAEDFRMMTMKVLRMQLQSITIMDLVSYLGTAAGVSLAVVAYRNGSITLFGFICIALLSVEFFVPMRLLGSYFHVGMNGMSALKRLTAIMEMEPSSPSSKISETEISGDIELQHVAFCYPGTSSRFIIQPVTCAIRKGQFIGIAGISGSGKTTLSQLIQGFLKPSSGEISLGGIRMEKLSAAAIHHFIGSVGSHPHLFEGTVLTNLQLGNDTISEEEASEILKFVRLEEFAEYLHAPVRSEGANLSSGQRQKLAIARMLLKNPEVLLFDEATANIDQQSEQDIFELIGKLHISGKTIIVITHQLSHIRKADCILTFEQGILAERGTHEYLLTQKGIYARLYEEQQSLEVGAA